MADDAPPETPGTRRRPHKKMTDADKAILADILRRPDVLVEGKIHIRTVEKITGLSYQQIYGFIQNDRYLAAQLAQADPGRLVPGEEDQIDGNGTEPPTGVMVSNSQFEEYRALIRQSKKMLAADWKALGMTEEAGKRMEHYITLGTAPTSQILRGATGQLISNLELLDRIIKKDCELILTDNLPEETTRNGEPKDPELVQREWRQTVFQGMTLQLSMFSHLHKVQALMARVMKELQLMNGGAPPAAKGTFEAQTRPVAATAVSERDAS